MPAMIQFMLLHSGLIPQEAILPILKAMALARPPQIKVPEPTARPTTLAASEDRSFDLNLTCMECMTSVKPLYRNHTAGKHVESDPSIATPDTGTEETIAHGHQLTAIRSREEDTISPSLKTKTDDLYQGGTDESSAGRDEGVDVRPQ